MHIVKNSSSTQQTVFNLHFFSGALNTVCVSRWNLPWRNILLYIHNFCANLPLAMDWLRLGVVGCNYAWRNNDPFDGWYLLQRCFVEVLLKLFLHFSNLAIMFVFILGHLQQPQHWAGVGGKEKVSHWKSLWEWAIQPVTSQSQFAFWFGASCLHLEFLIWDWSLLVLSFRSQLVALQTAPLIAFSCQTL